MQEQLRTMINRLSLYLTHASHLFPMNRDKFPGNVRDLGNLNDSNSARLDLYRPISDFAFLTIFGISFSFCNYSFIECVVDADQLIAMERIFVLDIYL
jgi:hypothetical protein